MLDRPRIRKGTLYLNSNTVALMGGECAELIEKQIIYREKKIVLIGLLVDFKYKQFSPESVHCIL